MIYLRINVTTIIFFFFYFYFLPCSTSYKLCTNIRYHYNSNYSDNRVHNNNDLLRNLYKTKHNTIILRKFMQRAVTLVRILTHRLYYCGRVLITLLLWIKIEINEI